MAHLRSWRGRLPPGWPRAAAALGVFLLFYGCWQVFRWPPGHRPLAGDLFFVPVDVAAIVLAWRASVRCGERWRLRLAWRVLAVAFASYLAGDLVWTIYEVVGAKPYPSVADVFYLLFYPLMLWALLLFSVGRRGVAVRVRVGLDLAVVALSAAMVVIYVVLGPTIVQRGPDALETVISVAYPVGDVVLLVGLGSVLLRGSLGSSARALQFIAAGLLCFVVGDLLYGYITLHSTYVGGDPVDSLWMVSVAMFAIAGAAQAAPVHDRDRVHSRRRERASWPPYIAVAIGFGLLVAVHGSDRLFPDAALLFGAVLIAALVSIRQFLAQADLARTQKRMLHQSLHDALTGLPNRALAIDRAQQMLARARRTHSRPAALAIGVDDFKRVNGSLGHAAGDELLRVVASRLLEVVRESDTVARLGGDEFVVLLETPAEDGQPGAIAERICDVVRQPIDLDGSAERSVSVTASVGIAVADHESAEDVLRDADIALHEAKSRGKNGWVTLGTDLLSAVQDRRELELDLKQALNADQFFLLYQPIFDLQTVTSTGVEALIRWRHPTRGIIPPATFIPLAEESGLIVPLGQWVLRTACAQGARWHDSARPIGLWINVSARQLEHATVVHDVAATLAETGLWPGALTLEITETALMRDPIAATQALRDLKALGVRIAIDDFGTGYSSLAYLRQLPVDVLKIDRSFISGIASSTESDALTHTLVQLGKTLGLQTVGEGIEQWGQLRRLQCEHCDLGQGFLFARPLEADIITELLRTDQHDLAEQLDPTTTLAADHSSSARSRPDPSHSAPVVARTPRKARAPRPSS